MMVKEFIVPFVILQYRGVLTTVASNATISYTNHVPNCPAKQHTSCTKNTLLPSFQALLLVIGNVTLAIVVSRPLPTIVLAVDSPSTSNVLHNHSLFNMKVMSTRSPCCQNQPFSVVMLVAPRVKASLTYVQPAFFGSTQCAAVPLSVNRIHHSHPLYLTRSLSRLRFIANRFRFTANKCQICGLKVNLDYWFYYCEGCNFIIDMGCATSETEPIRDDTSSVKEYEHLTTKISLEDERVETELEHYCHEHHLILCDVVPKDEKCNGCMRPILDPYYNCHQCKFSLHVSCTKLSMELQHPLHPEHRLPLLPKSPYQDGIFRCEACTNLCNGFTYSCVKCKFNLDVACSSIVETLKHDGHEHLLVLGQKTSCEQCSACGEDCVGFAYGCGDCNFKLDTNCASLPGKAKHRFHRHTLNLTFSSIKDDSDEYYCDACEESRNPNYWVYHCAECCNLSAHLGCIKGEYPYIKFGGIYKGDSHPHLLTLVQKTKDNPPTCNACDYPCESLTFECAECKFNMHWMCKNSPKDPRLRVKYLMDKAVYMMTQEDAKEICQKEKRSTNLKHFTHDIDDHFLAPRYIRNEIEKCIACKIHLEGPCYQCQKCKIYIHRKCAEAPPVLHHKDHKQHPLKLNLFKWPQNQFICSLCKNTGDSYGYQCEDCNFNLHMQCSSTRRKIHQMSHPQQQFLSEVGGILKGQMHK